MKKPALTLQGADASGCKYYPQCLTRLPQPTYGTLQVRVELAHLHRLRAGKRARKNKI